MDSCGSFLQSHGFRHFTWNWWPHGNTVPRMRSPRVISSRQIPHIIGLSGSLCHGNRALSLASSRLSFFCSLVIIFFILQHKKGRGKPFRYYDLSCRILCCLLQHTYFSVQYVNRGHGKNSLALGSLAGWLKRRIRDSADSLCRHIAPSTSRLCAAPSCVCIASTAVCSSSP